MTKPVDHKVEDAPDSDAQRFEKTMRRVLSVSKDELKRREAEYRKEREAQRAERETPLDTEPTPRTP